MRRIVALLVFLTAAIPAHADLSDANVRNAGELMAFGTLCKTNEARGLAAQYSRMSGRPQDAKSYAAFRVKQVKKSGNITQFCRTTRRNLPNFANSLKANDPTINLQVPGAVVIQAENDCDVAVPLRTTARMRELYTICVQQQVDIWKLQQRWN